MPSPQFQDLDELYARTRESQDEATTRQWRDIAQRDLERLSRWMEQVPLDDCHYLGYVYEGVSQCVPVPHELFVRELRRVLDLAARNPEKAEVFELLSWHALPAGIAPPGPLAESAELVLGALRSPVARIRRSAAKLAGDFLAARSAALEEELRSRATNDPDLRVRVFAFESLRDAQQDIRLSEPPSLRFADKLLARIWRELKPVDWC